MQGNDTPVACAESLAQEAASQACLNRPFQSSHPERRHDTSRPWIAPYSFNAAPGPGEGSGSHRFGSAARAVAAPTWRHLDERSDECASTPGPSSPAPAYLESEPLLAGRQRHASTLAHPHWQHDTGELSAELQGEPFHPKMAEWHLLPCLLYYVLLLSTLAARCG